MAIAALLIIHGLVQLNVLRQPKVWQITNKLIYYIIGYSSTFSPLIAIIPILIWRKSLPVALVSFLFYLVLCLVTDIASIAVTKATGTNLWLVNSYILFIPLTLAFPFQQIIHNKIMKSACIGAFLLCFALIVVQSLNMDFYGTLNSHGLALCSIATIFACLFYLLDLAIYSNVSDLSKESYIYVVTGFLVANSTVVLYFMAYELIGATAIDFGWIMKFVTYIILHALIAYTVLIKSGKIHVAK